MFWPDLLHRSTVPDATEIGFWVNSSLDLLTIEADIAGVVSFLIRACERIAGELRGVSPPC